MYKVQPWPRLKLTPIQSVKLSSRNVLDIIMLSHSDVRSVKEIYGMIFFRRLDINRSQLFTVILTVKNNNFVSKFLWSKYFNHHIVIVEWPSILFSHVGRHITYQQIHFLLFSSSLWDHETITGFLMCFPSNHLSVFSLQFMSARSMDTNRVWLWDKVSPCLMKHRRRPAYKYPPILETHYGIRTIFLYNDMPFWATKVWRRSTFIRD